MKKIILLKHCGWIKLVLGTLLVQILLFGNQAAFASGQEDKSIEEVFITLEKNTNTLRQIIKLIERETDFSFSYYKNEIDLESVIISPEKKVSVYQLLQEASRQQPLAFRQVDRFINIKPKPVKEITSTKSAFAISVSGVVTSADTGETLPGVNVQVVGTNKGTVTDLDGKYTIDVENSAAILEFSYIGFENMRANVGNRTQIDVALVESATGLEEVVVVGYGTQKKVNLTGSIASVKTDDIVDVPLANLSNGIAGRAPGVQVVGTSGLAGASSSIRIRGSDDEPLYVINGVIRSKAEFDALNPNEVENISFLKDAASAAIYGSSAGNGVVLVTTKGGSNQKPVFEYKGNYSSSKSTRPIQDYSAQDELRFNNNVAISKGLPEPYGEEVMNYFSDKSYSINDLIWQTPTVQEHNLSVRGGSEEVNYYVMMGYHTEEGSYKNLGYDRYNFRSDISAKITERLKMSLNISGNQRDYNRWYWPYDGAEDFNVGDFYRATFNWTRLYPFYVDEAGNPTNNPNDIPVKTSGGWHPPQLMLNEGGYRDTRYRTLDGILKLDLDLGDFVEGLSTSVQGNINAYDRNMKSFVVHNKYYIFQSASATNKFIPGPVNFNQMGSHNLSSGYENIQENITLSNAYQFNWFLNYQRSFGNHDISALAVYEQAGSKSKYINGRAEDLLSTTIDQIYNTSSDTERRWFSGSEGEFARASWIGRANYKFAQKYIAEFSFRYDGNYKFAPGKRWGFFPSGSLAWRLSEEEFMKDLSIFDDLKLRASYGTTGSDSGIGAWRWGQVYQKTGGYVFGSSLYDGLVPGAVPNPDITWSTISMWNAGLEFGLFNNRLVGDFDVWGKTESDILGTRLGTTPTTYGASLPAVNYAERSWKGLEINLDWRNRIGELEYSIYGNMGYARDQWDILDEPESFTDGTYEGNWRSSIGHPDDRISGYISKGIIRTQEQLDALPEGFTQFGREPVLGTILFEDIRGANYSEGADGKIDGNDQTILSDNAKPRINYGLGFRGEWKGFSLNVHFQGVGAYDRMISTRNGGGVFQVGDRPYFELWSQDEYWTPENTDAKYPRVAGVWMQPEYGGGPSTFWMRNGAYLRLKNLNLGYALPQKWFSKLGINKVQLYGNATNLFVITDLKEHDPEQATLDSYPLMKTFTGGLTVQF
ncbi:SusC/RagA family TonB-linked outer membrane protein [Echinicola shivajiensis]|uniref:SusC/RagA family TonB-linked outer membrane protein n=1 Tax=Echinicola shivajiensis TaxID=1035916 RepID=UPI001BFCD540|nr:TonB-dependent receptor [Echinicola shivajiensis]